MHVKNFLGSGSVLSDVVPRKKFASDLSIVTDRTGIPAPDSGSGSGPNSLPEGVRSRLSSHRSDHEIHTPEHRSLGTFRRPPVGKRESRVSEVRSSPKCASLADVEQVRAWFEFFFGLLICRF